MPNISLSSALLVVLAIVVAMFLFVAAIWVYVFTDVKFFGNSSEPGADVVSTNDFSSTNSKVSSEAREVLQNAWEANWQERDNEASIAELEQKINQWESTGQMGEVPMGRDQWEVQLSLAEMYLRHDAEKGLEIMAQVFNDPEVYPDVARNRALKSALWHTASHGGHTNIKTGGLPMEDAKRLVLAPDKFGSVLGIESTSTLERIQSQDDMSSYLQTGFNYLAENTRSNKVTIFANIFANYLGATDIRVELREAIVANGFDPDNLSTTVFDATPRGDEFESRYISMVDNARSFEEEVEAMANDVETYPVYESNILMSYYNVLRTYDRAAEVGLDVLPDTLRVYNRILAYADRFTEFSFFTGIIKAESGVKVMCQLVKEGEYNIENIDVNRVKQTLSHVLSLSAEDRSRRSGLASVSEDKNHRCYEPFVFVGNEIEPAFKEFLINDIHYPGVGWKASDFDTR